MASSIISKIFPTVPGEPSIYETFQQHEDDTSDHSSIPGPASMTLEEENLDLRSHDNVLDTAGEPGSASTPSDSASSRQTCRISHSKSRTRTQTKSKGKSVEDVENEVPQSLLIEDEEDGTTDLRAKQPLSLPPPVPGPSSRTTQAKWRVAQQEQRLHQEIPPVRSRQHFISHQGRFPGLIDPKKRATWMWANVENLDRFLAEVYDYYMGHGLWSILLSRVVKLLTLAFVVAFSTFLTTCIDYKGVPESKAMSQILIPRCTKRISSSASVLLWLFAFFWVFKVFDYCRDIRRLRSIQSFYRYLLDIPDSDMQTVSWQEVVKKLMNLRDMNPVTAPASIERHRRFMGSQSKQRMDAHDIANRLMRRDNYMIALINKDVLDFSLPLPFLRNRQLFSRTLEWNLQYCILDFVFNEQGQVRSLFLKDSHRQQLSEGFRSRFLFAGFISLVCAPFAVLYYMLFYFFRYFTEYQRNPSQIGSRQYTPFAEWKFREFNELQHLFERRINMSYPFASRYLDQFPKDKTVQVCGFVAFVSGALASVLALASLIDPELFLAFEITPERTVLFYLTVFGTIWALAKGNIPEENVVFDPEYALSNVTEYTHYMPSHWKGKLHTNEVRTEFAQFYQMKVSIFLQEILSIALTPLILWFSLSQRCDRLVDFFREFTVHVDGMGHLCSFALFDFKKGGANTTQLDIEVARDLREEYYSTKDGKMLASYYGFIDNYVSNQRPGAHYIHSANRRSFHAPPTFPSLISPTSDAEAQNPSPVQGGHADRHKAPNRSVTAGFGADNRSSHIRTQRVVPEQSQPFPMASILLDPQHQPSSRSVQRARKLDNQSRLRISHAPLDHPIEDEEEAASDMTPRLEENGSEGAEDESNLDESWKTDRVGIRDEGDAEDGDGWKEDKAPGVLGMVYQFSRATEGRPGVNI